jgi:hypothetical protein
MISFFNFLNNVIKKRTIETPNLSNGSTVAMGVVILYKGVICFMLYIILFIYVHIGQLLYIIYIKKYIYIHTYK